MKIKSKKAIFIANSNYIFYLMAKNTHKHYETTFIVDSILEDERVDAIVNKYHSFFAKNEGEVLKTEKWGRRKMAYAIKKKQTGSYVTIEFTADPSVIAKLERAYHLDDDIMRFLTVTFDKKTLEERNAYLIKKEQILAEREAAAKLAAEQSSATDKNAGEKVAAGDKVNAGDKVAAGDKVSATDKVAEAKPEDK